MRRYEEKAASDWERIRSVCSIVLSRSSVIDRDWTTGGRFTAQLLRIYLVLGEMAGHSLSKDDQTSVMCYFGDIRAVVIAPPHTTSGSLAMMKLSYNVVCGSMLWKHTVLTISLTVILSCPTEDGAPADERPAQESVINRM